MFDTLKPSCPLRPHVFYQLFHYVHMLPSPQYPNVRFSTCKMQKIESNIGKLRNLKKSEILNLFDFFKFCNLWFNLR